MTTSGAPILIAGAGIGGLALALGLSRRGIDVRIMIPIKNDVRFMRWISLPILHALARKGVKVFMY